MSCINPDWTFQDKQHAVFFLRNVAEMMMIGNVRVKEVQTQVFLELHQLSKSCIGRGMRPALVVPYLREILVKGETTRAEKRLLAWTDKQLYAWFRDCFLTAKSRAGVQELGEKLDVTRRDRMVATL